MKYNKNIILNILTDDFENEIAEYVLDCIWNLDGSDLYDAFESVIDYADLDYIDKISLIRYEVDEEKNEECIHGVIEIIAYIDGYVHWDGENMLMGGAPFMLGVEFSFMIEEGIAEGLELEYIY